MLGAHCGTSQLIKDLFEARVFSINQKDGHRWFIHHSSINFPRELKRRLFLIYKKSSLLKSFSTFCVLPTFRAIINPANDRMMTSSCLTQIDLSPNSDVAKVENEWILVTYISWSRCCRRRVVCRTGLHLHGFVAMLIWPQSLCDYIGLVYRT